MSLSGNTEKITELISKINALPEAGSGGGSGGGVETCTVQVIGTSSTAKFNVASYTYLDENGNIKAKALSLTNAGLTNVIENVVCGSVMVLVSNSGSAPVLTNATLLHSSQSSHISVSIDAKAGGTTTIQNYGGGGSN